LASEALTKSSTQGKRCAHIELLGNFWMYSLKDLGAVIEAGCAQLEILVVGSAPLRSML